ncbi:hypothetical protein NVIRPANT_00409 [Pantoea sp. Nvir]|nr:hypothetical protein NVIRPANT_00409 [Pantoea sp. Nvir]
MVFNICFIKYNSYSSQLYKYLDLPAEGHHVHK